MLQSPQNSAPGRTLVFFPTYNEAGNVERLVGAIREVLPGAQILAVDDASTDATGAILDRLAAQHEELRVVHRPRKMGVGTAHKLAMLHAREQRYERLITMDADFSHHPRYLPRFVELLREHEFVTGSRYVEGGRCDYRLYRTLMSRAANTVARVALGLELHENTTLFRGFTLALLDRLDIDQIRSEGYSFAVDSLFQLKQVSQHLVEFPIHFADRHEGVSKISRLEVWRAMLTVLRLLGRRIQAKPTPARPAPPHRAPVQCCSCGGTYQVEFLPPRLESAPPQASSYSCATLSTRAHGQILQCLQCGLVFMRPRLEASELAEAYANVEDPTYLANTAARETTFRTNLQGVQHFVGPSDRLLDVGSYCGVFLKVCEEAGIDAVGLEPSRWAVEASRGVTRAPVYCGTLDAPPRDLGRFDVITLWDVLEHFSDPVKELEKIRSRLEPGGIFMLSTLMIDNWFPRLAGRRWPWFMDMHLFYFTEATLRETLERAGFVIIDSRRYCHVITLAYLVTKLGTLGLPLAGRLGEAMADWRLGRLQIPFRFGDVKLVVCRRDDAPAQAAG